MTCSTARAALIRHFKAGLDYTTGTGCPSPSFSGIEHAARCGKHSGARARCLCLSCFHHVGGPRPRDSAAVSYTMSVHPRPQMLQPGRVAQPDSWHATPGSWHSVCLTLRGAACAVQQWYTCTGLTCTVTWATLRLVRDRSYFAAEGRAFGENCQSVTKFSSRTIAATAP